VGIHIGRRSRVSSSDALSRTIIAQSQSFSSQVIDLFIGLWAPSGAFDAIDTRVYA